MKQYDKYESIFYENINHIKSNDILIDQHLLDPDNDNRTGLSIITKPGYGIKNLYDSLINGFRKIEPDQYYYPFTDLHITVFDFITAGENIQFNDKLLENYISVTGKVFKNEFPITIVFKGVVFSKAAGLIKGYDHDDRIINIRHKIRVCLQESGIKANERYESVTTHMTFCRFTRKIKNCEDFLFHMSRIKEIPLGNYTFDYIDIVIHDWYNKSEKCKFIKRMLLK